MPLTLLLLPQTFAIARLANTAPLPSWLRWSGPLVAVTYTDEELSIVCPAEWVPPQVTAVADWRAFKVQGPLDFSLTGIMASLSGDLAAAEVSLFALSTYDTDYLLVQQPQLGRAIAALAGYELLLPTAGDNR